MCTPTTLRFCTCAVTDLPNELHIWKWVRPQESDFALQTIGLFVFPEGTETLNAATLEAALNREGSFDTALAFAPKDQLVVVLFQHTEREATFSFVWENGVWEFDPLGDWGGTVLREGRVEL